MGVLTDPVIGPLSMPVFLILLIFIGVFLKFVQVMYQKTQNEKMRVGKIWTTFVPEHGHEYECACIVDGIRIIPPTGKEYTKLTGVKRADTLPNVYFLGPRRANDEEFAEIDERKEQLKGLLANAHNPENLSQIAEWKRELDYLYEKEFMMIEKPPITTVVIPRGKSGFFGRMVTVQMGHVTLREINADPVNPYGQIQLVDPIVLKAQMSAGIAELVVKTVGDYLDVFKDLQKSLDKLRSANPTIVYLLLAGAIGVGIINLIIVAPKIGKVVSMLTQLLVANGIVVQ